MVMKSSHSQSIDIVQVAQGIDRSPIKHSEIMFKEFEDRKVLKNREIQASKSAKRSVKY